MSINVCLDHPYGAAAEGSRKHRLVVDGLSGWVGVVRVPGRNVCFVCGFAAPSPGQCWQRALPLPTAVLGSRRAPGVLLADFLQLVGEARLRV